MTLFLFLVWLQMSAQPVTRVTMYESMCRRPMVEYGGRYQVIAGAGECFIFERNIGEVYWSGPHGPAILFPIGSPLDDITRAEFAEAAQRAADETDGKPHLTTHQETRTELRAAEPVDVPAVEDRKLVVKKGELAGDTLCRFFLEQSDQNCRASANIYHSTFTCADKSRVLLTSEDGKKHCVKF